MFKTIISHFYNEEYLLPWWLEHHKKHFDFGLLINYASTDRSVEIIKDICPDWAIVDSINQMFDAKLCDEEVMTYEQGLKGWKVAINVTEFLVGNFDIMNDVADQEIKIPCVAMIDEDPSQVPVYSKPLIEQKKFGIDFTRSTIIRPPKIYRRPRCIHNKNNVKYNLGRHYTSYDTDQLKILWYGYSPYTEQLKKRKLQIQYKIPELDKMRGFGGEHLVNSNDLDLIYAHYKMQAYKIL